MQKYYPIIEVSFYFYVLNAICVWKRGSKSG